MTAQPDVVVSSWASEKVIPLEQHVGVPGGEGGSGLDGHRHHAATGREIEELAAVWCDKEISLYWEGVGV